PEPEADMPAPPEHPPASVPHQADYGDWDQSRYQNAGYDENAYAATPYQQQYPADAYGGQQYPAEGYPQQDGAYDPYGYGAPRQGYDQTYPQGYDGTTYPQGYDTPYDPHGTGNERPDGSQQ
ncbi:hypothetical protein, partial [Streptomyces tunisiensis]